MELWMKIAMIVVAVMSVLGLTAFILVIRHTSERWSKSFRVNPYRPVIFDDIRRLESKIDFCMDKINNCEHSQNVTNDETYNQIKKLKKRVKRMERFLNAVKP